MWTVENRGRYNRHELRYQSDLTAGQRALIEPLIPPGKPGGGKRRMNLREVVNGLMYALSTGGRWRAIPNDLPPRSRVYDYFDLRTRDDTLEKTERDASPTAPIIDSQSVKTAEKGEF